MSENWVSNSFYFVAGIAVTVVVEKIVEMGLSYLGKCVLQEVNEETLMHHLLRRQSMRQRSRVSHMLPELRKIKNALFVTCYLLSLISYILFFCFGVYLGLKYRIGVWALSIILIASEVLFDIVYWLLSPIRVNYMNWELERDNMLFAFLLMVVVGLFVALLSCLWTIWTLWNLCLFLIILIVLEVEHGFINEGNIKWELATVNILFALVLMLVVALFVSFLSCLWTLWTRWNIWFCLIILIALVHKDGIINGGNIKWKDVMVHILYYFMIRLVVIPLFVYFLPCLWTLWNRWNLWICLIVLIVLVHKDGFINGGNMDWEDVAIEILFYFGLRLVVIPLFVSVLSYLWALINFIWQNRF